MIFKVITWMSPGLDSKADNNRCALSIWSGTQPYRSPKRPMKDGRQFSIPERLVRRTSPASACFRLIPRLDLPLQRPFAWRDNAPSAQERCRDLQHIAEGAANEYTEHSGCVSYDSDS